MDLVGLALLCCRLPAAMVFAEASETSGENTQEGRRDTGNERKEARGIRTFGNKNSNN